MALLSLLLFLLTGCSGGDSHKGHIVGMEAFSELKTPAFVLDLHDVESHILSLARADTSQLDADRQTRSYYRGEGRALIWVSRMGADHRADSLLSWLRQVDKIGFSAQAFGITAIESDLHRIRTLDFDDKQNQASKVVARLEYMLTRAFLRYCIGQRYGYVNPYKLLNGLDVEKQDTLGNVIKYRELFDVKMDLPAKDFARMALRKVSVDSLADYLHSIEPTDRFFITLKGMLATARSNEEKRRIMVNMERARWRRHQPIAEEGKRVIVNIPAFHLYAYSAEDSLDMRVVCGNVKTKTPQLSSNIEWMEVDPQWVIPQSIIDNEVSRHAGDTAYFRRNRYNIYERSTGNQVSVAAVTRQMMNSGKYRIAQEGGEGNSLGRIVFRFKNNFSVFLHDTSNPGAFERNARGMSHGCVRVAKPFDLARFVLDEPDEWLLDRIRISMGLHPETEKGQQYVAEHEGENSKLIGYVPVKPRVPIYIIYYTLWPDMDGVLQTWPDVYGFDNVMWKQLKNYM